MSIKFYGKSQEVAQGVLDWFEAGSLPAALAQVFINRADNVPSSAWSWGNQFIQAISGTTDARGFRQWETAGRRVKKGARAFYILGPVLGKKETEENGEKKEVPVIFGFKSIPVFRLEDTEISDPEKWEIAGGVDQKEERRLEELPLRQVADAWGLKVTSYNGRETGALGYYSHGGTIAIGVENLSTWAHELIHAAEDKLGTITKAPGQQPDNEIVAEVGGAVLLIMMGHDQAADLGGALEYIKAYAGKDTGKAVRAAMSLINRICGAVDLIINTAAEAENQKAA